MDSYLMCADTSPNSGHTATPRSAQIRQSRSSYVRRALYVMPKRIMKQEG